MEKTTVLVSDKTDGVDRDADRVDRDADRVDSQNVKTETEQEDSAPIVNIPHVGTSLLLTLKNSFDAEIYIDMLKQYDIAAIYEPVDPIVMNPADSTAVNVYVQTPQFERALKLVEAFENKPIEYHAPPPRLNQVSKVNRFVYGVFMFFLLVVPLGAALIYLVYRIVKMIAAQ